MMYHLFLKVQNIMGYIIKISFYITISVFSLINTLLKKKLRILWCNKTR